MSEHNHSDDDNLSSSSSKSSATSLPFACPYCSWNKQSRYLFGHIVSEHYKEIYGYIGDANQVKEDLEEGNLLRIFWSYNIYKPDDVLKEYPDTHNSEVFGCLACKGSYQKKFKAQSHWRKSPKCHKEHTKRVKKFLEEIDKFEKNQKPWFEELTEQEIDIGIERFRRWYYRVLHLDIPSCQKHALNLGKTVHQKFYNFEFKSSFIDFKEKLDSYRYYTTFIHNLNIHIHKKFYIDYRLPNPFGVIDTFKEEGLPSVGTSFDRVPVEDKERERKLLEELIGKEQQKVYEKRLQDELAKLKVQIKKEEASGAYEEKKEEEKAVEKKEIKLETITEEVPKKEKRNSFTIPRPNMTSLITTPTAPAPVVYPSIINNTKKREAKKPPSG
jgi:hypothetical protein